MIINLPNNTSNNFKNDYYIEKLDILNNQDWDKKYFDVTYIDSKISFNNYKMIFNTKLNIASRNKLPIGTFLMNIILPGMEIMNIPIYDKYEVPTTNISHYPSWICKTYEANIEIDIFENQYFNREIINENIKVNYTFDIDTETFNKNNIKYTHESLSTLFYEVKNKNLNSSFDYSNSIIIDKSREVKIPIINYFDTNNKNIIDYTKVNFLMPNYFDKYIIDKLFTLRSKSNNINIIGFDINFFYYQNDFLNKLEISQKDTNILINNYDLFLNKFITFNFLNNKFEERIGNLGIVFPFETYGFYEIKFNLNVFGKDYKIYLKNNFNINNISWVKYEKEQIDWDDYEKVK